MPSLLLKHPHLRQIIEQAKADAPHETCGLLLGKNGIVQKIIPIPNTATDRLRQYRLDEQTWLNALKRMDAEGLDCLGIYHSHPRTEANPSKEDIQHAMRETPHLFHLIIGLKTTRPDVRAWWIHDGMVERVDLQFHKTNDIVMVLSASHQRAILLTAILAVFILIWIALNLLPPAPILTN